MRIVVLATAAAGFMSAAVDFKTQVQPVLVKQCIACHGAERPAGGVRITDRASVLKGGMIVPGKPEASLFYRVIELPPGTPKAMPPGQQMSKVERDLIRQWIAEGAVWPEGVSLVSPVGAAKDEREIVK